MTHRAEMGKPTKQRPVMPTETYTVTLERDAVTGVVVHERWEKGGKTHREGAPALISRDPETGIVIDELWMRNNETHRDDGPAQILRKGDTGRIYYSAWYMAGKKIKPPRPAPGGARLGPNRQPAP